MKDDQQVSTHRDPRSAQFSWDDQPGSESIGASAAAALPPEKLAAWEEVDAGRYMPRRVRGSCVGRALG